MEQTFASNFKIPETDLKIKINKYITIKDASLEQQ